MRTILRLTFATLFLLSIGSQSNVALAENFYVSPNGDDANPGTRREPWQTMTAACLRLLPGDTLRVFPGCYDAESVDDGRIFVRFVDVEDNFLYKPLGGTKSERVRIIAIGRGPHIVKGYFDIRGSYITIKGLTVVGDGERISPGIGVYESHNITIRNCASVNHGGGGISFNHCDMVSAMWNLTAFNSSTNPAQTSGISSYQSIVRTDSPSKNGVRFLGNLSFYNQNLVPNINGDITDGNGIIVDDHNYTQPNEIIAAAIKGEAREGSVGTPVIETFDDGQPIPYQRRAVVSGNTCFNNGGRGVHFFEASNGIVRFNLCYNNLQSPAFTEGLPRDVDGDGEPFFVNGEFSIVNSSFVRVFGNVGLTCGPIQAAAVEQFFGNFLPTRVSPNRWFANLFLNFGSGPNSQVYGADDSDLLNR